MDIDAEMQRAHIEAIRLVQSVLPQSATASVGEWFVADAGVDNPDFNSALVEGAAERAAMEVEEVVRWYGERGAGWQYRLRPGADDAVIEALRGRAEESPRREPYMWRAVEGMSVAAGELRIERVHDRPGLEAYDAFDAARGRPSEWSIAEAVMDLPQCSLWLGWLGDAAVARAMAVATAPIGSITNVVVEESFRRRGFGRAITAAAAMACASGGSEGVALGASRMGYPLYLSMGFEHRYDLAALTPRPPLPTPREMGSEPSRSAPLPEGEGS